MQIKKLLITSITAAVLVACGGGEGGSSSPTATSGPTLSGTAAGGAAVVGTVTVTDSLGATKSTIIEADGKYTVSVSGMTGPFILKALGTLGNNSVSYYSAATSADVNGNVNVTPLTNMIVSNIAGGLAETYFANPANLATLGTKFTSTNLAAATSDLQTKLAPILTALGVSASIDLMRASFATDKSGLDAVLDLVKVETDPNTNIITLKNAITNLTIATDDTAIQTDNTAVTANLTGIDTTSVTDLQAVVAKMNAFAALFANIVPASNAIIASGLFDNTGLFLQDGKTLQQFADDLSSDGQIVGLKFNNIDIKLDANGTNAGLTAQVSANNPAVNGKIFLKMVKTSGVWSSIGNQRIAELGTKARAQRSESTNTQNGNVITNPRTTGINFDVRTEFYDAANSGSPVTTAVITGPGLPNGGVTMVPGTGKWFKLQGSNYDENLFPECPNGVTTQCVNVALALDNSEYTVVLKNGAGTTVNGTGDKIVLTKQPLTTAQANASTLFPTISSTLVDGVAATFANAQTGSNLFVSWTLPTGTTASYVSASRNTNNGTSNVGKDIAGNTSGNTTLSLGTALTSPVTGTGLCISSRDVFRREFNTCSNYY